MFFRKKLLFTTLSLFAFSLCACEKRYGYRDNWIEEGTFFGVDSSGAYDCALVVERITKEEYEEADGINVVEDLARSGHYRLSFTAKDGEQNEYGYTFINLKEPFDGKFGTWLEYHDDNDAHFDPLPSFAADRTQVGYYVMTDIKGEPIRVTLEHEGGN